MTYFAIYLYLIGGMTFYAHYEKDVHFKDLSHWTFLVLWFFVLPFCMAWALKDYLKGDK